MKPPRSGLLQGKKQIQEFLGGISEHRLQKLVARGLPVRIENGHWLAHEDNIEDFIRAYTRVDNRPKAEKEPIK